MGYAYPIDSKVVNKPNGTIDYDRASSSAQLRGLIRSMITNGVNLTESTNLQVIADETMNVTVKAGYVIIEGAVKQFEDDVKLKIPNADSTHPRIDTVVARLNLNEDVRDIVIDVLQGTPSAEPTAPELTRTTSYYEVGLADILVEVGAEQISQEVVTDTRLLNSRCGLATAIGEIDTETLFVQLTTDFNNWFESIKGQLSEDVAGSLQLQLDTHTTSTVSSEEGVHGFRYFENVFEIKDQEGNFQNVTPVNLKWDISDNLYSESREVSTLPRDISKGQGVKLKDVFYIIGGDTTKGTALPSYKYVDGEWIEDATLGPISTMNTSLSRTTLSYNGSGGVATDNNILYGHETTENNTTVRYNMATLFKYDGETKTKVYNYYGDYSDSRVKYGNVGIAISPSGYKTISTGSYYSTYYFYGLMVGTEQTGKYTTLKRYGGSADVDIFQPLTHGVYYKNKYVYVVSQADGSQYYSSSSNSSIKYTNRYYLLMLSESNSIVQTIDLPNPEGLVTDMALIGDYIYVTYSNGNVYRWRESNSNKWEHVNIGLGSLVEHNGEIHRFYGTSHTAHKLYRTAKTYAPKGTKIYLQGETLPLSENLLTIDNGYVVTQDGEVKIAIYE